MRGAFVRGKTDEQDTGALRPSRPQGACFPSAAGRAGASDFAIRFPQRAANREPGPRPAAAAIPGGQRGRAESYFPC